MYIKWIYVIVTWFFFLLAADILCDQNPNYEFYISTGREIISIKESADNSLTAEILLNRGLKEVEVLDVDYRDHKVYWADMELKTINRVATNTTSKDAFETVCLLKCLSVVYQHFF